MKCAKRSQAFIIAGSILAGGLAYALHSADRKSNANQPAALHGEQAIGSLKQDGVYDSLQAAVSAARYRIYFDERTSNAFYANNSAQQLSAYFTRDAVRLTIKHGANSDELTSEVTEPATTQAPAQSEQSHLSLKFIGAGYGDTIHLAQGRPAITTADNRLTYTHQLTSNHDSTSGWLSLFSRAAVRNPQSAIVEEWYINKPEGIEHGFTLGEPVGERREGEMLKVELGLDGDFLAQAVEEGKRVVFKSKDGGAQLSYAGLKVFDAHGRECVAQMSVNDTVLSFEVDDTDADYPITIDPTFTQQQKLVPGFSASDSFGTDVAINGDTAVVGVPLDDAGANQNQGSIFVFVRSGTTWSQQARLFASDGAADDNFGSSVAISANTVVVGALADDIGVDQNQGSAYVFVRSGTIWSQQAKLTGDGLDELLGRDVAIDGDYAAIGGSGRVQIFHRTGTSWTNESTVAGSSGGFGASVSLSGDTLIVGAPDFTVCIPPPVNDCNTFGAAVIFVRSGTVWNNQKFIVGASETSGIGGSVAISGNTAVIGAKLKTASSTTNRVEIWFRSGTNWTQQSVINGLPNENIGKAVTIDGDTVVYTAPGGSKVLSRTGATWTTQATLTSVGDKVSLSGNTLLTGSTGYAKVDFRTGTTWAEQAELTAQEGGTADQFGYSVAIDEDTAVVGVPFKNVGAASDRGSVFVFKRSGSTWQQEAQLTASDGAAGHRFGETVAIEGDTVAVGATQPLVGLGAVYVFTRSGSTWTQRTKINATDGQAVDLFGNSVALSGNTLVVGAVLEESSGGFNTGSAYVFTGSGATWTEQAKLRAIEEADGDQFGHDVDINGETIAVGARLVANGANTAQGAAYVFTRAGTTWTQQARLLSSDGATDDHFGESISVSGDRLAVGSPFHNVGANSNQGAVYLFNRSGSTWTESQILMANDGATDDTFGISVALQSNALLVGASADDFASTNAQGSAYVFIPFGSTWTQTQKLFAVDGATNDGYGNAVAFDDRTLLIGASNDDFGSTVDQGSAFAYVPSGPSVWTGANSANWSAGSNWDSSVAPNVFDDVLLPASGVTNEAVLNINSNIHGLTIEAGRSLTINAARTLTVNGDLTLNGTIVGGGTLVFNGTNFINNNSANVANVRFGVGVKPLSGTGSFFGNTVTVLSSSTLELNSNHTMNRLVVNNGGTLNITSTNILSLLGSGIALTNNGSVTGAGAVSFDGTSAQSTSGNVAFPGLTINNPAGVTLGADATVSGVLNLTSGDLNTGAFTLTMPATATSTGATDVVGNIKRTGFTTANTLTFGNPFNTIQFTSGTPSTDVTVNLVKQAPSDFANATRRTYTITPNGGSGFAATLRLHYQDSELNGNTEPTLGLWRKGASWTNLGATTRNATDNWVELAGIAQFSPWVISGPAAPTVANSISGTISYCIDQTKKVPNVTVATSSGTPSASTTTNASGFYQLDNLGVGPYTVAPSKTGAVSGISAFDAALVAQYAAGITTPTSCQQLGGDVSNNGALSAFDAALIAQTAAGISNPGIAGTWKFIPSSRPYPTLSGNLINENYDAVLVGDVSGNWTPAGPEGPPKGALGGPAGGGNVAVSLPDQAAAPGAANVMVPVFVDNTTGQGIIAYDFTFTFPTAGVIQLASPAFETSGTLSAGWNITPNTSTAGQIRIVAFNTVPLSGQGTLIFLKFNVVGAQGAMTPLTWTNFVFNEGSPSATSTNGKFTASGPTAVKLEKFTATGYDGGVYLEWKTGLEADNLGFNVYRERAGQKELVTPEVVAGSALLTGQTSLQTGRTYSWWDNGIADCGSPSADCKNALYWLEDIDLNGQSNWHGPLSPQLVGGTPPAHSDAAALSRIGKPQTPQASTPVERRTPARASSAAIQPVPAGGSAVKVSVRREGWYRLSLTELVAAGLNPNADPDHLQMYVDGEQIPINVITGDKNQLSAIEFYGTGLDAAYTDARAYLIVEGKEKGLRIELIKADAHPSTARSFSYSVERRDRTIYFSGLRNAERENFFGPVVGREAIVQSLTLQRIDRTATTQAQVEVSLQGVTTIPHRVWVNVNGSFVGEVVFNGQESKAASFSLPLSQLKDGDNAVQLVARGGPADVSLIDYVRLSYPRTFTAESDQLRFVATEGAAVTVDGFSSSAIRVFDVTNQDRVQQLAGKIEQGKNGYAITVASAEKGERTLLAIAGQTAGAQAGISASAASDLRSNNHAANLLIITNRDFFAALEPLKKLRMSQGYKVEMVDVEAIYDQFSFGNKSPYAVRDFLSYARANWKIAPQYVLLGGDASYDPKNYLGFGDWDVVPTRLIDTTLMETASDDWFADFNADGVPEMAVGRLSARTREEADRLVARIIGYEQSSPAAELTLVADANDGYDFEGANSQLRALVPGDIRVVEIARGRMGSQAKAALIDAINRGQKIVNYTGHGNVNQWRADLLTNADAALFTNQNHLAVFVMMTCLNGYFDDPALSSLAEALMKSPGGAVAVWASSGMTMPDEQASMNREFYRQVFANKGIALGDAIRRAKAAVSDGDVRRTWILLGDPTMRLR